jgi:hypothetical protein
VGAGFRSALLRPNDRSSTCQVDEEATGEGPPARLDGLRMVGAGWATGYPVSSARWRARSPSALQRVLTRRGGGIRLDGLIGAGVVGRGRVRGAGRVAAGLAELAGQVGQAVP